MCPRCGILHEVADYPGAELLCEKCWLPWEDPEERRQKMHERVDELIAAIDWENRPLNELQSAATIHQTINDGRDKTIAKWMRWLERLRQETPRCDVLGGEQPSWLAGVIWPR